MTIEELISVVKTIALEKVGIESFHVGNNYDQSLTKGDQYPHCWFETPILVSYNIQGRFYKTFDFSINIIALPDLDSPSDEVQKISDCEVLMDKFIQYFQLDDDYKLAESPSALSIKSINADDAAGVRCDFKVNLKRECLS